MSNLQPNLPPHDDLRDDLDAILELHFNAPAAQLTPSSGFMLSVMETIQQQATEPPPITFPWRRALPGVIAALCALVGFGVLLFTVPFAVPAPEPRLREYAAALASMNRETVVLSSIVAAICVSLVTLAASLRIATRTH